MLNRRTVVTGTIAALGPSGHGLGPGFGRPDPPGGPLRPGRLDRHSARVLAERMSTDLGRTVIVENRPGGGTMVGMENVARSKPDGNSLLLMTTTAALLPAFDIPLAVEPQKELTRCRSSPTSRASWRSMRTPSQDLPRIHRPGKGTARPRALFAIEYRRPAASVGRTGRASGTAASCNTSPIRPPPKRARHRRRSRPAFVEHHAGRQQILPARCAA